MQDLYIKTKDIDKDIAEHFRNKDLISIEDLLDYIDELQYEVNELQHEYDNYKEFVHENYRQISMSEQIGYDPRLH